MQRYFLTQFYNDTEWDRLVPVASDYGHGWMCPQFPTEPDGWAICSVQSEPLQIEAAKQDDRVLVLPLIFDPSPLPQQVIDTYADRGAVAGMSLGALLAKLADSEPLYGQSQ